MLNGLIKGLNVKVQRTDHGLKLDYTLETSPCDDCSSHKILCPCPNLSEYARRLVPLLDYSGRSVQDVKW